MLITRISGISGVERTREIDVTIEQMNMWRNGVCIQKAMPHLSEDDREFLMTGITPEEWNEAMKEGEEQPSDSEDSAF